MTHKDPSWELRAHEHGHGLQNILWGQLMPIVITIPSAICYHLRRHRERMGKGTSLPPYDSIWFEGQASALGRALLKKTRDTVMQCLDAFYIQEIPYI